MKHLRLILISLVMLFAGRGYAESASSLEYKIKAVVLVNFAKYVQWPEKVLKADQPLQVCILGDSPFGDVFQSDEAPKEAQGHPLKFVQLSDAASKDEVKACQVLYWLDKYDSKVAGLKATLDENSVLTVADQDSKNAVISFTHESEGEQDKVRFKIKRKSAEKLGLQMSSQLLKLAITSDE